MNQGGSGLRCRATGLVAALAAISACSGDMGAAPVSIDTFGAEFTLAVCKQYIACLDLPDQAACAAAMDLGNARFETLKLDIANGTVV